jgi:hypothetical protein
MKTGVEKSFFWHANEATEEKNPNPDNCRDIFPI